MSFSFELDATSSESRIESIFVRPSTKCAISLPNIVCISSIVISVSSTTSCNNAEIAIDSSFVIDATILATKIG